MSTIRCIYTQEPGFPATDQHQDAVRYQIGSYWVDAVGGEPSLADVEAHFRPAPVLSPQRERKRDLEKLEKAVADVEQPAINALLLKILKERA